MGATSGRHPGSGSRPHEPSYNGNRLCQNAAMPQSAPQPASKLPDVQTTIFTVMSELARQEGALNLSQGFPDFDGPRYLLERVQHHLRHGQNQYAPMTGVPALRAAIAAKVRDGKVAAAGALVGAVMKTTRGQADAKTVRDLILSRLTG